MTSSTSNEYYIKKNLHIIVHQEKIMIRSLSLALVLSLFIFSAAEAKIGAAPFNQVIQESEMGKSANSLMESKFGKDKSKLDAEIAAFQKEAEAFQKQAAALSEKARMQKAQELDKKARDLDIRRNGFAQKAAPIQQKVNAIMKGIVDEATANVAKAEKLDMIFDTTPPVIYLAPSASVEDEIRKEINKLWKKNGSKFKI